MVKRPQVLFLLITLCLSQNLTAANGERTQIGEDLYILELANNVWMHVSTTELPSWGKVSANGLAIQDGDNVILIDTPWNNDQTQRLATWFELNHGASITAVVVSHYHGDNLGGLEWIHDKGIDSYSTLKTQEICQGLGLEIPKQTIEYDETLVFSNEPIRVFFPGEGHTVDSVCAYLPLKYILFGGCSIKAIDARALGNTADANLSEWPNSLGRLREEFLEADIVVPGHGEIGTLQLIEHTLSLLRQRS